MMCLSQKIFNPPFACCLSRMIAKLILVSRTNSRKGPERLTVYDLVSPILSSLSHNSHLLCIGIVCTVLKLSLRMSFKDSIH